MIKLTEVIGTPSLEYHLKEGIDLHENIYRYSSEKFISLFKEARDGYNSGDIELKGLDLVLVTETDIGLYGIYNGKKVPLDLPYFESEILEAEYRGKKVPLNKPKRGGSKAYYVYVKNKKGNVLKISFGSGGLQAKVSDPEAKKNFAARHNCKEKKDKTTAGYWSCRLPRYWKRLGGSRNYSGYW